MQELNPSNPLYVLNQTKLMINSNVNKKIKLGTFDFGSAMKAHASQSKYYITLFGYCVGVPRFLRTRHI